MDNNNKYYQKLNEMQEELTKRAEKELNLKIEISKLEQQLQEKN